MSLVVYCMHAPKRVLLIARSGYFRGSAASYKEHPKTTTIARIV